MSGGNSVQEDEFDVVASWTAETLRSRTRAQAIAGACNGSCSPGALAWLAESLRLERGEGLLDVGSGLGGALAWAEDRYGVKGLGVEPMCRAAQGARVLFDQLAVAGTASALPLPDASFDACWVLGVLDTLSDPSLALCELRRVLTDDGRLAVLAYVATSAVDQSDAPSGNQFVDEDRLVDLLRESGFVALDRCGADELPEPPLDWRLERDRVGAEIKLRHGAESAWRRTLDQRDRIAQLLEDDKVGTLLLHAACV